MCAGDPAPVFADLGARADVEDTPTGYKLTPAGKERALALFADDITRLGDAADVLYDAFCAVNDDVKQTVTDWQPRVVAGSPSLNDHSDDAHDAAVLARLADVHQRVVPITEAGAERLSRFEGYLTRFDAALSAITAGDRSFVDAPLTNSYHTDWFELHEDLILSTGRTRGEEARSGRGGHRSTHTPALP
jgi:hypothetical protein